MDFSPDITVCTIPVPVGWSAEQAWHHLSLGRLFGPGYVIGSWANVVVADIQTSEDGTQTTGGTLIKVYYDSDDIDDD